MYCQLGRCGGGGASSGSSTVSLGAAAPVLARAASDDLRFLARRSRASRARPCARVRHQLLLRRTFLRPRADRGLAARPRALQRRPVPVERRFFDDGFVVGRRVIEQGPIVRARWCRWARIAALPISRLRCSGSGSALRFFGEHDLFEDPEPVSCSASEGEMKISDTSVADASNSSDSSSGTSSAGSGSGSGSSALALALAPALVPAQVPAPSPRRSPARVPPRFGCGFEQATIGGVGRAAAGLTFAQRDQRVEDVRAAAAAHVTLAGAQIHGRYDQRQRAFRTDGEQANCFRLVAAAAGERRPAVAGAQKARYQTTVHARVSPRQPARSSRPASTIFPPGRVSAAKRGASSHSGPHRMLASRMSAPAGRARVRVHHVHLRFDAVGGGIVARRGERLRIDVVGVGLRARRASRRRPRARPSRSRSRWRAGRPRRVSSSQARHIAVVACVPVPNARPGSSRTITASFGVDMRVMGRDPQPPAETHRMEVAQPLAFPDAVGQRFDAERVRARRAARARAAPRAPAARSRTGTAPAAANAATGGIRPARARGSDRRAGRCTTRRARRTRNRPPRRARRRARPASASGQAAACSWIARLLQAEAALQVVDVLRRRVRNAWCVKISWCRAVLVLMPSTTISASALRMRAIAVSRVSP